MKSFLRVLRSPVTLTVVAALIVSTAVVFALRDEGFEAHDVDVRLQDVWVTNSSQQLLGRINTQVDELNSAMQAGNGIDLLQDVGAVFVVDPQADELREVDQVSVTPGSKVALPTNGTAALGGGILAVSEPGTGKLWSGAPADMAFLDINTRQPDVLTDPNAAMVVSTLGTVFAVAPGSSTLWIVPQPGDTSHTGSPAPLPEGADLDDDDEAEDAPARSRALESTLPGGALSDNSTVQLTTVGDTPVVLDAGDGTLRLGNRSVDLSDVTSADPSSLVLQQPGPEAASVLVAGPEALIEIPLASGQPARVVEGQAGAPVAPVRLGACVHGAWIGEAPTYAISCGGEAPTIQPIPGMSSSAQAVFRVNGDAIVLNDTVTGAAWVADEDLRLINNWDDVRPESDDTSQDSDQHSDAVDLTSSRSSCASGKVDLPVAADDEFGVRPGRPTILQVLRNDYSSDCSMAVITSATGWESTPASVDIVASGQALQVTVPEDYDGTLPVLTYQVSDGLGHDAAAKVAVSVVPRDIEDPPVKLYDLTVPVETLGTVSYNVLSSYYSPNGDDLFLRSASVEGGDEVSFQPDGTIIFADKGVGGIVKKTVDFVVSDGRNDVLGTLGINVTPAGAADPVAAPVYARVMVGRSKPVDVFAKVTSPSIEPLQLTAVEPIGTRSMSMITGVFQTEGTVVVLGDAVGTHYFTYEVTTGTKTAQGLLRVDVVDPVADAAPPVAMADVAYLPDGGVVSLDPIGNDTDPMGSGLAIVEVQRDPRLTVAVERMQLVTISTDRQLPPGGVSLRYTVANAASGEVGTTEGIIRVLPIPAQDPLPPIAKNIDVTVRAGDATTIPIVDHARDPNGEVLTLTGLEPADLAPGRGVLFHTDSAIRYLAPPEAPATPITFSYTVQNVSGKSETARVTIAVVDAPLSENRSPAQPLPKLVRAFTNQTVTTRLPLNGIDPDGDWVMAQEMTDPVARDGRAELVDTATARYAAGPRSGFDTFGYVAADPYGKTTAGIVSVLVVTPPTSLEPPLAPDLRAVTRPGRTIAVNVLGPVQEANPSQQVTFADSPFDAPSAVAVRADEQQGALVIDTPATERVVSITYRVSNSAGMTASGVLTIVTSDTDELAPPTADDVIVSRSELERGQTSVDVVIPDEKLTNPAGTLRDLSIALDEQSPAGATVRGRTVTVPLTDTRQVLAYHVTNADDATATAFIVVPRMRKPNNPEDEELIVSVTGPKLSVDAGQDLTINIADQLAADDGSTLQIPVGAVPVVTGGGEVGRVNGTELRYTAPEDGDGEVTVTLPVTDGRRDVQVSLTVTVIPKVIPAPIVQDTAVPIEAGTSQTLDVSRFVTAGDEEQQRLLSYRISESTTSGIDISLEGSRLTIAASLDARDTSTTLTLVATDGQQKSGSGTVVITVTGSSQPRLRVDSIAITSGIPGATSTADVLGAVTYNPFDTAPSLVSAKVQSGDGTVAMTSDGKLDIVPGSVGTVVVSYTLRDATLDELRDVTGTVRVTVRDRPDVPGTPTVVSMESRTVQLKWTAPDSNGAPITQYVVADADSGFSQTCTSSPCTLKDLTNGTQYTFTVVAVNEIGSSDPSVASAPVTPDTAPNQPSAPQLNWLDGKTALQVNWSDPGSEGTAVTGYDLSISPADEKGRSIIHLDGTATSYTWDNLKFGREYTFRVRAANRSAFTSMWSSYSSGEIPSTSTTAPREVSVSFGSDNYNPSGHSLTVTWKAPEGTGGAPITSYVIYYNDQQIKISDAAQRSAKIQQLSAGVEYRVTVAAVNRSGPGAQSAEVKATPYSAPGKVPSLTATAKGDSGKVDLKWEKASEHGRSISLYRITGTGVAQELPASATTTTISGLTNGTKYIFKIEACYSDADTPAAHSCSDSTTSSNEVTPYGPVGDPRDRTVTVTGAAEPYSLVFKWKDPAPNGRPATARYSVTGKDGAYTEGLTVTIDGVACETSTSVWVRSVDTEGQKSEPVEIKGTTPACPPTEWQLQVVTDTCAVGSPGDPASDPCADPDVPFAVGATLDIKCLTTDDWYQVKSGPAAGRYVPKADLTGDTTAMPTCT